MVAELVDLLVRFFLAGAHRAARAKVDIKEKVEKVLKIQGEAGDYDLARRLSMYALRRELISFCNRVETFLWSSYDPSLPWTSFR